MPKQILKASIAEISEDTKFIRLATLTTFVHSLLFILYLIYFMLSLVSQVQGSDSQIVTTIQEYAQIISSDSTLIVVFLVLCVIALIGYYLLPPIGEAAMIYYLDSAEKGGTISFGKGVNRFFPMFEFDAAISLFNVFVLLIVVSRLRVMGIMHQPLIIAVLAIWVFMIFAISLLLPYTRMLITLEKQNFLDAMRDSMKLSFQHIGTTFKYVVINYLLYVRFIVNMVIVLGIPLFLAYLAYRFDVIENVAIQIGGVVITIGLILLTAYINGIIEAFLTTYRYKVYLQIKNEEK